MDRRTHPAPARPAGAARGRGAALARLVRAAWASWWRSARTLIVVGIVSVFTTGLRGGAAEDDATFTIVATLIQSAVFVGHRGAVRLVHAQAEGRGTSACGGPGSGRRSGWAALGMFSFYVLAAIYSVIVQPDAEQTVAEDLGSDQGTFGLIAAGFMIVCVAPVRPRSSSSAASSTRRSARASRRWSPRSSTARCSASSTSTSRAPTRCSSSRRSRCSASSSASSTRGPARSTR